MTCTYLWVLVCARVILQYNILCTIITKRHVYEHTYDYKTTSLNEPIYNMIILYYTSIISIIRPLSRVSQRTVHENNVIIIVVIIRRRWRVKKNTRYFPQTLVFGTKIKSVHVHPPLPRYEYLPAYVCMYIVYCPSTVYIN